MSKNADNRIKELERQVAQVTQERDDLQRDVESLCMQNGGNMWSRSYVLSERFSFLELELSSAKQEIARLTAERDNLKEDLHQFKTSRKTVDNSLSELNDRNRVLEREIAFYQEQTARAVSDRDKYAYEAEELRHHNLRLEKESRDAKARADTEQSLKEGLQKDVASLQKLNKDLEFRAKDGERIPELTFTIDRQARRIQQLEEELKVTQDKLAESSAALVRASTDALEARTARTALQQMLEEKQKASAAKIARLEDQNKQLETEVEGHEAAIENLKAEIQTGSGTIAGLKTDLEKAEAASAQQLAELREKQQAELDGLNQELAAAKAQVEELRAEKQELAKAKVDALLRLEEQQVKYADAMGKEASLKQKVRDLREKLVGGGDGVSTASGTPTDVTTSFGSAPSSSSLLDHDDVDVPLLQQQLAGLQDKMQNVERLTAQSRPMREALADAAHQLWNQKRDEKVLGEIARVGEQCSVLRAQIGVPPRQEGRDGRKEGGGGGGGGGVPSSRRPDKQVAIEVVELLELTMDALKQYNQSLTLSSLMDAF